MMFIALAVVTIICIIIRYVRRNKLTQFKDNTKMIEETEHTLYVEK